MWRVLSCLPCFQLYLLYPLALVLKGEPDEISPVLDSATEASQTVYSLPTIAGSRRPESLAQTLQVYWQQERLGRLSLIRQAH
jgi:hypothetical protein